MKVKKTKENTQRIEDFLNFGDSHSSIIREQKRQESLTLELEDKSGFNEIISKMISTFAIFCGVYLTYSSSLVILQMLTVEISNSLLVLFMFITGGILTFLGVGTFHKKAKYLIHLIVPFLSFLTGFVFLLFPEHLQGKLFGGTSLLIFPVILFLFYYIKDCIKADSNFN